jgi:hypothetical protein
MSYEQFFWLLVMGALAAAGFIISELPTRPSKPR